MSRPDGGEMGERRLELLAIEEAPVLRSMR